VSTTMGPGMIRCGFRLRASGPRRLLTSTHRSSFEASTGSGATTNLCRPRLDVIRLA
jgi:hypothetical protein